MPRINTPEWFQALADELNASESYAEAAKKWEGDFIFHIIGDEDSQYTSEGEELYFWMDLYHGKCRDWKQLKDPSEKPDAEYVLSGKSPVWEDIIFNNTDPIKLMISRKLKLKGKMGKIMKNMKSVQELMKALDQVESE